MVHRSDIGIDTGITALAVISGVVVIVGALGNYFTNVIQVIGIGTAISLGVGAYKTVNDGREYRRRRRLEAIQRLRPTVYDVLFKWALTIQTFYKKQAAVEVVTPNALEIPNLNQVPDYIAHVGERLKNSFEKLSNEVHDHRVVRDKLQDEYRQRVIQSMIQFGFGDDPNQLNLWIDNANYGSVDNAIFAHGLATIKERIVRDTISLRYTQTQLSQMSLPQAMFDDIMQVETLSSYLEFERSKNEFIKQIDSFIAEMKDVLRNGEKDWNLP